MRAAGVAMPGSKSNSPKNRSSLSAATLSQKAAVNILARCWLGITKRLDCSLPAEWYGILRQALGGSLRWLAKDPPCHCPFVNLPEKRRGRWGQGITPTVMKRCVWVDPVLVSPVKFTKWTVTTSMASQGLQVRCVS
jgi:hypothetical protein